MFHLSLESSADRPRIWHRDKALFSWALDARGAIIYRSQEWSDYTGIHEPDLRSRLRSQAVHPEDFGTVERHVDTAVEQQTPFLLSYRLKRADQAYGWVTTGGAPSHSPVDGTFVGYLGTTRALSHPPATSEVDARHAVVVLDSIAAQIMAARELADRHDHPSVVKALEAALLLTGDLLFKELQKRP